MGSDPRLSGLVGNLEAEFDALDSFDFSTGVRRPKAASISSPAPPPTLHPRSSSVTRLHNDLDEQMAALDALVATSLNTERRVTKTATTTSGALRPAPGSDRPLAIASGATEPSEAVVAHAPPEPLTVPTAAPHPHAPTTPAAVAAQVDVVVSPAKEVPPMANHYHREPTQDDIDGAIARARARLKLRSEGASGSFSNLSAALSPGPALPSVPASPVTVAAPVPAPVSRDPPVGSHAEPVVNTSVVNATPTRTESAPVTVKPASTLPSTTVKEPEFKVDFVVNQPSQGFCLALYKFAGVESTDLALEKDDVIELHSKSSDGWWEGTNSRGARGLFPSTFVRELEPPEWPTTKLNNAGGTSLPVGTAAVAVATVDPVTKVAPVTTDASESTRPDAVPSSQRPTIVSPRRPAVMSPTRTAAVVSPTRVDGGLTRSATSPIPRRPAATSPLAASQQPVTAPLQRPTSPVPPSAATPTHQQARPLSPPPPAEAPKPSMVGRRAPAVSNPPPVTREPQEQPLSPRSREPTGVRKLFGFKSPERQTDRAPTPERSKSPKSAKPNKSPSKAPTSGRVMSPERARSPDPERNKSPKGAKPNKSPSRAPASARVMSPERARSPEPEDLLSSDGETDVRGPITLKPDYMGWTTKMGGRYKTWKRRFCVLQDSTLFYFKNDDRKTLSSGKPMGFIVTSGKDVGCLQYTQDKQAKKKSEFAFYVDDPERGRKYWFSVVDRTSENEWIQALVDRGGAKCDDDERRKKDKVAAGLRAIATAQTKQTGDEGYYIAWIRKTLGSGCPSLTSLERQLNDGLLLSQLLDTITGEVSFLPMKTNATAVGDKLRNLELVRDRIIGLGVPVDEWSCQDIVMGARTPMLSLLSTLEKYHQIHVDASIPHRTVTTKPRATPDDAFRSLTPAAPTPAPLAAPPAKPLPAAPQPRSAAPLVHNSTDSLVIWINQLVKPRGVTIQFVEDELQNGVVLCHLAEVLTKVELTKEGQTPWSRNPRDGANKLTNLKMALEAFERDGVTFSRIQPRELLMGMKTRECVQAIHDSYTSRALSTTTTAAMQPGISTSQAPPLSTVTGTAAGTDVPRVDTAANTTAAPARSVTEPPLTGTGGKSRMKGAATEIAKLDSLSKIILPWVNDVLSERSITVNDLSTQMKDFVNFYHLMDVLTGVNWSSRARLSAAPEDVAFNCTLGVEALTSCGVELVQCSMRDLSDGSYKGTIVLLGCLARKYKNWRTDRAPS